MNDAVQYIFKKIYYKILKVNIRLFKSINFVPVFFTKHTFVEVWLKILKVYN